MKIVFIDCEYTGEHAHSTLISIGLVTLEGKELYITLNDYAREQVTDWVTDNVLNQIDQSLSINSEEAVLAISSFFEKYADQQPISLVSAGKAMDLVLFFQLWHKLFPQESYFHYGKFLPVYLNHRAHFDLDTLFWASGIDPNSDREMFLELSASKDKHNALYDAQIVRQCFLKLSESPNFESCISKKSRKNESS